MQLPIILEIPVNYYARINLEGFRNIIDILGGVEFNVPFDMLYDDPAQNLHISLEKGLQILDGVKAEQLVRFNARVILKAILQECKCSKILLWNL